MPHSTHPCTEDELEFTRDLTTVQDSEKCYIRKRRERAVAEAALAGEEPHDSLGADIPDRGVVGLAFSGGGILATSFTLGLVQALSRYGILPWVDYLSSISGGGLTAACMTSLLSEHGTAFNTRWERFPFNPGKKIFESPEAKPQDQEGQDDNAAHIAIDQDTGELILGQNEQLTHLRNKGNYIIPRLGWINRDVLRAVGALLLSSGYTIFLFLLALLIVAVLHYGFVAVVSPGILGHVEFVPQDPAPEAVQHVQTVYMVFRYGDKETTLDSFEAIPSQPLTYDVTRILSLLFLDYRFQDYGEKAPSDQGAEGGESDPGPSRTPATVAAWPIGLCGLAFLTGIGFSFLFYYILLLLPYVFRKKEALPVIWAEPTRIRRLADRGGKRIKDLRRAIALWIYGRLKKDWEKDAAQGLAKQEHIDERAIHRLAAFMALMLVPMFVVRFLFVPDSVPGLRIFWIWLPLLFTLGCWFGASLLRLIGHSPPAKETRLRLPVWSEPAFRSIFWAWQGMLLYAAIICLVFAILVLPHFFLVRDVFGIVVTLAPFVSMAGGAYLALTGGGKKSNGSSRLPALPTELRDRLLSLLVLVLILSAFFLFQATIDGLAGASPVIGASEQIQTTVGQVTGLQNWIDWIAKQGGAGAGVLACAVVIALLGAGIFLAVGRLINFNYITPHYFTRDRIADAYLVTEVGAQVVRDHSDLALQKINPCGNSTPYHIVATTLNLPGSWQIQFKDRKSQLFIFSKYYCGSQVTGYRPTREYRDGLTRYMRTIAVSGAPISSSIGFRTFFAQAFMMTLLNVRLGMWMAHPGRNGEPGTWHATEMKAFWPRYLWDELRGLVNERRDMVNLSDGEHTGDSIALYPLFERRCPIIIAGDGSPDPEYTCGALFCVIHQVETDLGIRVDIDIDDLKPSITDEATDLKFSKTHCVVGRITYPPLDPGGKPETGWLIYFKPTMTRRVPWTLKHRQESNAPFPHTSIVDQFFDEEQFEATRRLGEFSVEDALRAWTGLGDNASEEDIALTVGDTIGRKGLLGLVRDRQSRQRTTPTKQARHFSQKPAM